MLKNYTSSVPVAQSIARIEQVLLKSGVTGITKEYGTNQKILALIFHVKMPIEGLSVQSVSVRLPAKEEQCIEAMWRDYMGDDLLPDGQVKWGSRKKLRRKDFVEQGERTAWKLMQDWVEVQMSFIHMGQVETMEVFLPFVWDGQRTFFEALKVNQFKQLSAGGT